MKGAASTADLRRALTLCASVVERRNTIDIIGNVRLSLDAPGQLAITATDLNCELLVTIDATVTEAGAITVPAHLLAEACRALPDGMVQIEMDMGSARFTSGKAQFDLPVLPVSDFPTLENGIDWKEATVPASSLRNIIDHASPCASRDDSAYHLAGIYFHEVDGVFRCAASDRKRMAYAEFGPLETLRGVKAIVSTKSVGILARLLDGAGEVDLAFCESLVRLKGPGFVFLARTIWGDYPDYQRTIPSAYLNEFSASRSDLTLAARRVALVTDDKVAGVRLDIGAKGADLSVRRRNSFGSARDHVDGSYAGTDLTIGLNARYLADALAAYDSDEVVVRLNDPKGSVGIFDPHDAGRGVILGTMVV